jgi:hypothetical protein
MLEPEARAEDQQGSRLMPYTPNLSKYGEESSNKRIPVLAGLLILGRSSPSLAAGSISAIRAQFPCSFAELIGISVLARSQKIVSVPIYDSPHLRGD